MYIIHEQQLIHVDRGSNVLQHYGVKGMKWGKQAVGYAASFNKAYANQFVHPVLSRNAYSSSVSKSRAGSMIGTKRSLDYQNKFVKTQKEANVNYKKKLKDLKNNKYKKANDLNKPVYKQLEKAYSQQEKTYNDLRKNSKLKNYLTKEGRKQRSEVKKEYSKSSDVASSLEDKMIKNYSKAKKNLKDERKNATTGLRY